MTGIIDALDEWLNQNYGNYSHTFWGFCELSRRTHDSATQPIPVKPNGTHKRDQIALDDKKQMVTWSRIEDNYATSTDIEGNDWDFGITTATVNTLAIRWVFALKVELGENLIYQISHQIPDFLTVSGFNLVSVNRAEITVDPDHETIYLTELGQGKYGQHRFPWNLYVINVPIDFILKPETCV